MAEHDNNHPYVIKRLGCGHGVLWVDPCVECEIVSLQAEYRNAARVIARVRDRMRQLGRPMLGETSGMHRVDVLGTTGAVSVGEGQP